MTGYAVELLWACARQFLCQGTDNQMVLEAKEDSPITVSDTKWCF